MAGANASLEPDEEKPLDPAAERVRRKLVRFMVVNFGILFAAVMAVVLALVYKSMAPQAGSSPTESASPASVTPTGEMLSGEIQLPAGSTIVSHSAAGNRLTLLVELQDGGEEFHLYDMSEKRLVGRFPVMRQGE
ncbi:fimbrial protein [Chelativorans sp.]|uniref:fimbrial protein n=1 Tax=Chelativorans sp. TaxID=2203393 RepID=UPI0028116A7B|nr:fimbrial protein [Chelativorans sp.]